MMAPTPPSISAASSAKSGDAYSSSSFMGGDFTFGGSGRGGANASGLESMLREYGLWIAAGAVVWLVLKRRKG